MKYPEYLKISLRNFTPANLKDFNSPDITVNFGKQRNRGGYKYKVIEKSYGEYANNGDNSFDLGLIKVL